MLLKRLASWGISFGLLTFFAMPGMANQIDTAVVTPTCNSFTIALSASQLNPGQNYEIDWSISVTDTCATPGTANYSITFTAPPSGTFSTTVTETFPPQPCPLTFSGTATLVGFNTIPITFPNGQTSITITCPAPSSVLSSASVTPTCNNYSIFVNASGLNPGQSYTIDYSIDVMPSCSPAFTITDSIPAVGDSNGNFSTTVTKPLGPLTCATSFSGSATLLGFNTVNITFSLASLNCTPPNICSALGPAGGFAVLGLQGSQINLSSGPLRINENVGIGQNGNFNFSGGGKVSGVLDADNTP